MKKLVIHTPAYEYIQAGFSEWLDIQGYAATTVYYMPLHVREFLHYLETQHITALQNIDTIHIKAYYEQLKTRSNQRQSGGLSNNHLNKHLQGLYKFTEYLRKTARIELPDLALGFEKSDHEKPDVLSVTEIKELYTLTYETYHCNMWEVLASRDRAILSVFYGCGLRRTEGRLLDLEDINLDRRMLHVRNGKGYKERLVPLSKTHAKHIETYIYDHRPLFQNSKTNEALFISWYGRRMESQSILLRLKLLQQRSDNITLNQKDIGLHTLRHSIATQLLQEGMELESISRFLGHSSLDSTQIYTHLAGIQNNETGKDPQHGKDI